MFFHYDKLRRRIKQIICFLTSLIFCLVISNLSLDFEGVNWSERATAKSVNAPELVQQGANSYQVGEYQQALTYWQQALSILERNNDRAYGAIVEENLARTYQQLGQNETAIAFWLKVADYYLTIKQEKKLGQIFTEQAQLYGSMGQPRKAFALLCGATPEEIESGCLPNSAIEIARTYKDDMGEIAALGSLGNIYRLLGDYDRSLSCLQSIIPTQEQTEIPKECQRKNRDNSIPSVYRSAALNSLGNTYASRANRFSIYAQSAQSRGAINLAASLAEKASLDKQKAINLFEESVALINTPQKQMQTLLNLINLEDSSSQKDKIWQQAVNLLEKIPDSRQKAYAAIKLANFSTQNSQDRCINSKRKEKLFNTALTIAQNLQDNRARSFAEGELGHLYECRQKYDRALKYTRQAQWYADRNLQDRDSLYLWEWQEGRILHQLGQSERAIPIYQRAIATLNKVREDILTQERELQLDFRDDIEPIYREFAELNLELAQQQKVDRQLFDTALQTIDELRIAELENYFGNDCILAATDKEQIKELLLGEDTAVFSSIILDNRTAIILSLPNGENKLSWIETSQDILRQEIVNFKTGLLDRSLIFYGDNPNQKPQAEKLYNWIVAPFQADLESARIQTLVFVQDGLLRNIPMAALYDGNNFLIQKYALATTPSLILTKVRTPRTQDFEVVAFGLSEPSMVDGEFFPPLTQVRLELANLTERFPQSTILLNRDFTRQNFRQAIKQAVNPIVHIATHGKFGTIPQDSFLVLGNNQKLTIPELERELEAIDRPDNSVTILALTACETATGDERATLGLAGTAVRAGVESTLASLWSIPDESTRVFIDLFYDFLQQGMSKAQALRSAQLALITAEERAEINNDYNHPFYWSAFISIGNWL